MLESDFLQGYVCMTQGMMSLSPTIQRWAREDEGWEILSMYTANPILHAGVFAGASVAKQVFPIGQFNYLSCKSLDDQQVA